MKRLLGIGLASCACLLAATPGPAFADPITVMNTKDSGPGSLRQALATANNGDTIVLPPGEITLTSGELVVNKSVTIQGAGSGQTGLNGNNAFRVLDIQGPVTVTVSGVQITGGNPAPVAGGALGGGILVHGSSLTLTNSLLTQNRADTTGSGTANGGISQGGAIAADTGASSLTLINTTISDNRALAGASGTGNGGIAEAGGVYDVGSLVMHGGALEGNTTDASSAGGAGGLAEGGGLIYNAASNANTAIVDGVRSRGNLVAANSGGSGKSGGSADGAGMEVLGGGSTTISNVTVNLNSVTANALNNADGGGAHSAGLSVFGAATASITNATITENSATANGQGTGKGGVAYAAGIGTGKAVSIRNSTIDGNTATATGPGGGGTLLGGDVYVGSASTTFENTIVADGVAASTNGNCFLAGPNYLISAGGNIDSTDQCSFHASGDHPNTNPLLGPLQSNGGPLETMAPAIGSLAIDGGSNAGCPATDARGVLRPAGLACDVGAFELAVASGVTGTASDVGSFTAMLHGTARNPDLAGGRVSFQYGKTTAYGSSTPAQPVGPTTPGAPVSAAVAGLSPSTTYHFREAVTNGLGTVVSGDGMFTTAPLSSTVGLTAQPRTTVSGSGLEFTIACRQRAGCPIQAVATTTERLRGRQVVSVSKRGLRKRTVVVGRVKATVASGAKRKITLKLDATGRRLLKRFGRLPVTVTITLTAPGGKRVVVRRTHVTIKPARKHRHR